MTMQEDLVRKHGEKLGKELAEVFEDDMLKATLIYRAENEKSVISVWWWNFADEYDTIIHNKVTGEYICFNSKYNEGGSQHNGSVKDFIKELD